MKQSAPKKKAPVWLVTVVVGALGVCCLGGVVAVINGADGDEQAASDPVAAAGIPPEPDAVTRGAYIDALDAIDPDIVYDDQDKAVDRGRNLCSSVKQWPTDQAKLVGLAEQRFTSPDHPEGFGDAKAKQILAAVRQYICPTY